MKTSLTTLRDTACLAAFLAVATVFSGCGGNTSTDDTPNPNPNPDPVVVVQDGIGRVQGTIDRVNEGRVAWENLKVAIKGTNSKGEPVEKEATIDKNTGDFTAENVPAGTYNVEVGSTDNSTVPVTVPNVVVVKDDTAFVKPNGQEQIDVVPSGVAVGTIEITAPSGAIAQGQAYAFKGRVLDSGGNELPDWNPRWAVEGNIGDINVQSGLLNASRAGTGRVIAYFYIGDRRVEGAAPITVSSVTLPNAPTLLLLGNTPGTANGLFRYNTRDKNQSSPIEVASSNYLSRCAAAPDGTVYVTYSGSHSVQQIRSDGSLGWVATDVRDDIEDIVVLPSGNVLTASTGAKGFWVFNKDTGVALSAATQNMLKGQWYPEGIYDMKIGPDGNLYVAGRASTSTITYVVRRYRIAADDVLEMDQQIVSGEQRYRGIAFLSNGTMALANGSGRALKVFTTDGKEIGGAIDVPSLAGQLAVGRTVYEEGDEIIFALTDDGVRRVKFSGGALTLLDTSQPYLSVSSGVDLAIP